MSKSMVKYKDSFITKFKNFFYNLFNQNEKNTEEVENFNVATNNNFKENIVIKQDKEELRILELQKEYKKGNILEKNMKEEDKNKLIGLYEKQNKELKEKIESKRHKIRKRLNELKTT